MPVRRRSPRRISRARTNPSFAEVRAHVGRAYDKAAPHARRAALATASGARKAYHYAKPRVKAGTRRALYGLSELSARGARALDDAPRANPARRRAGRSWNLVFVVRADGAVLCASRHRSVDAALAAARALRAKGKDARVQPDASYASRGSATLRGVPVIDTGSEEWVPKKRARSRASKR